MLRRGFSQLLARCPAVTSRAICTSHPALQETDDAVNVGKEEFTKHWEQRAPSTLKTPNFASDWIDESSDAAVPSDETKPTPSTTEIPKKLKLNFYMPSEIIMEATEVRHGLHSRVKSVREG